MASGIDNKSSHAKPQSQVFEILSRIIFFCLICLILPNLLISDQTSTCLNFYFKNLFE